MRNANHPRPRLRARLRWHRRLQVSLVIGEANFTYGRARCFFLYHPIPEAEQRPMAGVTQKLRPGFFFRKRLAADKSSYFGVRPHRSALDKVVEAMAAEFKPFGFEDGYCLGMVGVSGHSSSLLICRSRCHLARSRRCRLACAFGRLRLRSFATPEERLRSG
jgi:hypothetical protein